MWINCKYCNENFTGMTYAGYIRDDHELHCPKNENNYKNIQEEKEKQFKKDIILCQTQARISECLNCQRYQKECSGINKR
jgi:hypothetical protein